MVIDVVSFVNSNDVDVVLIDSGATIHLCGYRHIFVEGSLRTQNKSIRVADGKSVVSVLVGDIVIMIGNHKVVIPNVSYIDNNMCLILSVSRLADLNFATSSKKSL